MPQTSRYTKRRRNEEEIMTKLTPHIKPPTQKQRRTATEEPPWNGQNKNSLCYTRETSKTAFFLQSSQRSTLPPERPMNGERPERNRDRTGTGTTGTERPSVPFLAFLAFPVVPVHSSEKMERCLLKLSCYQTKRNLTFKTIQTDHSSRSNTYSKTVLS